MNNIRHSIIPNLLTKNYDCKLFFTKNLTKLGAEKVLWHIFLLDVLIEGSLDLLNLMLQTDPKKRITVQQLLTHPWLMDGYDKPVKYQSR